MISEISEISKISENKLKKILFKPYTIIMKRHWTKFNSSTALCNVNCECEESRLDFLSDSFKLKTSSLLLVVIIMSTNTEVLCGLGPWRPSFLQPLASKKVYLFFYGCLGIIQGMFFTYLRLIELIRLKLPNIRHMTDHRGQIVGQFRIHQRMDQFPPTLGFRPFGRRLPTL